MVAKGSFRAEPLPESPVREEYVLLALSASSREALDVRIDALIERLQRPARQDLWAICCELVNEAPHWAHRCALVAATAQDAVALLQAALSRQSHEQLFWSEWRSKPAPSAFLKRGAEALLVELAESDDACTDATPLLALADLYCQGYDLTSHRYFRRDRFSHTSTVSINGQGLSDAVLHPLVHQDVSTPEVIRYRTTFTGDEAFLQDHQVWGQKVLPGVAQLEWARAAACLALGDVHADVELQQVVFLRPLMVDTMLTVDIVLSAIAPGRFSYVIQLPAATLDSENVIYSQGQVQVVDAGAAPQLDMAGLPERTKQTLQGEAVWHEFAQRGLQLGPGFQIIQQLDVGDGIAVAHVQARHHLSEAARYRWWPMLTDGAAQSAAARFQDDDLYVPFSVQSIRSWRALPNPLLAVVQERADSSAAVRKWDVRLVDETGAVALLLEGIVTRRYALSRRHHLVLASPCWDNVAVPAGGKNRQRHVLLLGCNAAALGLDIKGDASLTSCVAFEVEGTLAEAYTQAAEKLLAWIKSTIVSARDESPTLLQLIVPATRAGALLDGLGSMLRTAQREYPRLQVQVVRVDSGDVTANNLRDAAATGLPFLRAKDGAWQTLRYQRLNSPDAPPCFRNDGVYWITGGLGGLGRLFAEEIARQTQHPRLILSGRHAPTPEQDAWLGELRASGAHVEVVVADVGSASAVTACVKRIKTQFGTVNGLIHAAGVLHDSLLVNKTGADLAKVFAPKVTGLAVLDEATADMHMDWLVLCSSTSSVWGNAGQADYAAANGFMDAFAHYRNQRVVAGDRHGHTLSIHWPFWAHGGMRAGEQGRARRALGLEDMPTDQGMLALRQALATGLTRVLVLYGDPKRLAASLEALGEPVIAKQSTQPAGEAHMAELMPRIVQAISVQLADQADTPVHTLDPERPLSELGFDSINLALVANALSAQYSIDLSPAAFFEASTIRGLAAHLAKVHGEAFARSFLQRPAEDGARKEAAS